MCLKVWSNHAFEIFLLQIRFFCFLLFWYTNIKNNFLKKKFIFIYFYIKNNNHLTTQNINKSSQSSSRLRPQHVSYYCQEFMFSTFACKCNLEFFPIFSPLKTRYFSPPREKLLHESSSPCRSHNQFTTSLA